MKCRPIIYHIKAKHQLHKSEHYFSVITKTNTPQGHTSYQSVMSFTQQQTFNTELIGQNEILSRMGHTLKKMIFQSILKGKETDNRAHNHLCCCHDSRGCR